MFQSKKVSFHTLGCKLNFAETSTIARLFADNGFTKTPFGTPTDVVVINTCSVTQNADKECKQIVRTALQTSPNAHVIVVGCYAQLKPEQIAQIKGVDLVLGAAEKFKIINYLNDVSKREHAQIHSCEIEEINQFVPSHSVADRTRSFLKVQDGCDYTCSYCTIPLARGASRSNTIDNVVKQAQQIAQQGIKEIVLTGVNIGDFGIRQNQNNTSKRTETFFQLIEALDNIDGIDRFRISSIEPNLLSNDIISFVAQSKKFTPHFHIPLQSASNKLLAMMRRRYKRELYADRVNLIKQFMPQCCIGADVIVGFPGETEDDFNSTYQFINELDINYLHVFTYSERDNTDAINLKNTVPIHIRKERNKMLRSLSAKKLRAFYNLHLNQSRSVLFEANNNNGFIHGYTDNYIKIKTVFNPSLVNTIQNVTIKTIDADGIALMEKNEEVLTHHI